MKRCPYCRHHFKLLTFFKDMGSDTLVESKGEVAAHHYREHICPACHKKYEIRYRGNHIKRFAKHYISFVFVPVVIAWAVSKGLFHLSTEGTVVAILLALLVFAPFFSTFIKYASAELKREEG